MQPLRVDRESDPPVYEPDDFAWITWPTSRCDNPDCFNWFDVDRKTCPTCCTVRHSHSRKRGK